MNALFSKNEGGLDRGVRVVIVLALLVLVFVGPRTLRGLHLQDGVARVITGGE